jgi:branched-subunit amino acid transport protein AzlD
MTMPDQFISAPGWVGNLALIVGSAAAYIAMKKKQSSDLVRFLGATLATTLFSALTISAARFRFETKPENDTQ